MAVITDATLAKVKTELQKRNGYIRTFVDKYAQTTWDGIQLDVKAGLAPSKYDIGDELVCNYAYNGTNYDFTWIVVDNDRDVIWQDGTQHPGMILQAKYATIESVPICPALTMEATEATAQDGWYYCGVSGSTYAMLNLAVGDAIPTTYDHVYKSAINHKDVYQYGYNRYSKSAYRQWLNSDGSQNHWWTSQFNGDIEPSQHATYKGFLAGLDEDFLAVINPVKVQVAANTVTDGGVTDVMYDKFWLPSVEEMYGAPQASDIEGAYFPYWKTKTGLNAPSNDANNGRIITALDAKTSAQYCRCRSANRGNSTHVWYVTTTGTLSSGNASTALRSVPACAIS